MTFDPLGAWRLAPQVSLRPEPFGALLYHFGTRRLSFLKTPTMVAVVQGLEQHPTARAACLDAGVATDELAAYEKALAGLAAASTIVPAG
ncbi:MAG TPA: mycofactocin biosynthesis chaperone MftB [Acidimicrobiales bacterium]|nr:mycofactocin biosynthesis chaperone MftB [Acidimicrobiales bacterium]